MYICYPKFDVHFAHGHIRVYGYVTVSPIYEELCCFYNFDLDLRFKLCHDVFIVLQSLEISFEK